MRNEKLGPTAALAEFIASTTYARLPEFVVRESKRCILDFLGVALGAVGTAAPNIALEEVRAAGGNPQATVLGYGDRVAVAQAALVDGILSHVLDFDDTHVVTILHGSAPTLSAALPLGEWRGASGRDLILAHALGFEAGARVSLAVWPDHYDVGWHMTGTAGTICAAAAVASLLGLGADRTVHALGLAATQAAGHREQFGAMAKSFHAGKAAANGVLAAQLAARGYTAAPESLEGRRGLFHVMSARSDPEAVTRELGERWEIARNGFKPFACGVVTHPAIDVARRLRERGVAADEIERIDLRVHPLVLELCGKRDVATGLEGKFSVSYCVAVMLLEGAARHRQFTDDLAARTDVRELARKVHAVADAGMASTEAVGVCALGDGREVTEHVAAATGTPGNPISDDELRAKFLDLAAPQVGAAVGEEIVDLVEHLESAASLAPLVALTEARGVSAA